jgi:hypothetical protein
VEPMNAHSAVFIGVNTTGDEDMLHTPIYLAY